MIKNINLYYFQNDKNKIIIIFFLFITKNFITLISKVKLY